MGGKGGGGEAAQARADEQARQERVRSGTANVNSTFDSQFNDDFFRGRRDAFTAYATPQIEDQYADAQKQLTYALARTGNLDSSSRATQTADLQKRYDLSKQQIADQALASEGETRNAVESARADLIAMLNATGDADGAANSALARASALSKPAAFSPLTNLFADFTTGLANRQQWNNFNKYSGGQTSSTLFAPKTGSVVNK